TMRGALVLTPGKYTGRSPNDQCIVDTEGAHNGIAWGKVNKPISREKFDAIKGKVAAYLQGREIFIFDGYAGADPKYTKKFRIVNELASQNLFIHQLLIRPPPSSWRPTASPTTPCWWPPASSATLRSTASTARPPS